MMAGRQLFSCVLAVLFVAEALGKGSYFISSPKDIKRGSVYSVLVDILNVTSAHVTAVLQESVYNGKTNRQDIISLKNESDIVYKGQRGHLVFPIEDDFKCRNCQLLLQGRGDIVFERTEHISVLSSVVSIFIQTDKAMYKPGQEVRYRAFAVYPSLQVFNGAFTVTISDPAGNKIKVDKAQKSESGVIEGKIQLSDEPPFGDWSINVAAEDLSDENTQTFTVAVYDLPRFEVTVDIPSFGLLRDSRLSGTIKAKYTYGKPVKGMVDLYVGPDGLDMCGRMPKSVNNAFEIDGEAAFSIPKSSIDRVMSIYANTKVRVTAIVKEGATGVKLNGTKTITYHANEFSVNFMTNTPSVFKPGLPYTAYVQVNSPDGLPPPFAENNTIVIYPYAEFLVKVNNQDKYGVSDFTGTFPLPKINVSVPASGIVPIHIDIPKNATKIVMKAYFKSFSATKTVTKTYSPSKNYMQLTLKGSDLKAGERASFKIQTTEPVDNFFYEVVARGNIQESGARFGNNKRIQMFDLHLTPSMGPVATLLTYYVRNDSEIVADSIAFNVDGVFENKVTINFDTKTTEPQGKTDLRVTADAKSTVFLMAVDQSVLLLKSGNDIDIKKVENGISDVKPLDSEHALSNSASNVGEVFRKSGLLYVTDAVMAAPYRPPYGYRGRNRYRFDGDMELGVPGPSMVRSMSALDNDIGPKSSASAKSETKVRKQFPEAWLWTSVETLDDGTAVINTTVPDTITTWIASAFATHRSSGLGVAPMRANITVFKSFFVSLTYPSIVKRNEQAVIQATVFNYLPTTTQVKVTMKNSNGLQHIQVSEDGTETVLNSPPVKMIQVRSNSEGVVYFPVIAKEIGVFDIEVSALSSNVAADAVRRQITVEPEGAPASFNIPVFIQQDRKTKTIEDTYSFTFPESTVPGSQKINVGVSGDLIGQSLDNIDSLLSIPTGCGEQNLVKFAPNLYIAQYLKSSKQLTDRRRQDLVDALSAGYQRQLSYLRYDGSFSPFGNNDQSGSTWLTAHVTRVLSESREFIYVDPKVLTEAIDWLVERQKNDGGFAELGRVIDPNTQGSNSGPALTAFCLLTLKQNMDLISLQKCEDHSVNCIRTMKWMNATEKATEYLERKVSSIHDSFPLSVVSYALNVVKSRKGNYAIRKLWRLFTTEGGLTFLKEADDEKKTTPVRVFGTWLPAPKARPVNILSTSYTVMAYIARGQVKRVLPMVKWLISQKNAQGGFSSSQDTTVALQALSLFATKSFHPTTRLDMSFKTSPNEVLRFRINNDNILNFQTREFPETIFSNNKKEYSVNFVSNGYGLAIAEIGFSFNTKEVAPSKSFDVSTVLLDDELDNFNLMICTKKLKDEKSGMVVQEIEIPSGFEPDLTTIGNVVGMKRFERKGNMVAIYFDEIVRTSTCYSIVMTRRSKVAKSEKMSVHTFSYYKPDAESTVFYQPMRLKDATVCDVCPRCCR